MHLYASESKACMCIHFHTLIHRSKYCQILLFLPSHIERFQMRTVGYFKTWRSPEIQDSIKTYFEKYFLFLNLGPDNLLTPVLVNVIYGWQLCEVRETCSFKRHSVFWEAGFVLQLMFMNKISKGFIYIPQNLNIKLVIC